MSENKIAKVIYIMGIDGSGKTTVAEHLAESIKAKGFDVDILWLRFNHVLTKPLLGLCRLLGYTKYYTIDGIRVGYHEFHRSNLISWAFIILQYFDAVLATYLKLSPRLKKTQQVTILDRYIYDIIIDIAIDTGRDDFVNSWFGERFKALLPKDTVILPVMREEAALLNARPESKVDRDFNKRLSLYQTLVISEKLTPLINDSALDKLLTNASKRVGLL